MPAGVSAYTALANLTLTGSVATVTLSSISQSFRDLVLVCQVTGTVSTVPVLRINSDTGGSYFNVNLYVNGTSVGASNYAGDTQAFLGFNALLDSTNANLSKTEFMDYSATNKQKIFLVRDNSVSSAIEMSAQRWSSTSAINTIQIRPLSGSFTSGSTFALYGVSA